MSIQLVSIWRRTFYLLCLISIISSVSLSLDQSEKKIIETTSIFEIAPRQGLSTEETDLAGDFYWILEEIAQIDLVNNSSNLVIDSLTLVLQNDPCGNTRELRINIGNQILSQEISTGVPFRREIQLRIPPFTMEALTVVSSGSKCEITSDPRSFFAKMYIN